MKKLLCAELCCALLLSFAAGESAYEQIEMASTLEEITLLFGEGEPVGEYLAFGDALCAFYESGRLTAKSLSYEDVREKAAMTQADFAKVRDFREGALLSNLTDILGPGTEILRMNLSDEDNAGQRILLAWQNESGGVLEALFELDAGEWILFAIGEIA